MKEETVYAKEIIYPSFFLLKYYSLENYEWYIQDAGLISLHLSEVNYWEGGHRFFKTVDSTTLWSVYLQIYKK